MATERLDKIVSAAGGLTRSEARRLIKIGQVTVNGVPVRTFGFQVEPQRDQIIAAGEFLRYQAHGYLMLYKPMGVVSASRGKGELTVVDLVPQPLRRPGLFPAGRLDKDTTGFVLLTDDGPFAHAILSPKRHVPKTYEAVLDNPVTQATLAAFRAGITAADGTVFQCAELEVLAPDQNLVQVVLHEGKYHQVKRMFACCGLHVQQLHRSKIGNLSLDASLKPGDCREITKEELKKITEIL